jgi:hypothetical protein
MGVYCRMARPTSRRIAIAHVPIAYLCCMSPGAHTASHQLASYILYPSIQLRGIAQAVLFGEPHLLSEGLPIFLDRMSEC